MISTIFDMIKNQTWDAVKDIVHGEYFYTVNNIKHLYNGNMTACLYQYNMHDKIEKTFILLFIQDKLSLITEKTF